MNLLSRNGVRRAFLDLSKWDRDREAARAACLRLVDHGAAGGACDEDCVLPDYVLGAAELDEYESEGAPGWNAWGSMVASLRVWAAYGDASGLWGLCSNPRLAVFDDRHGGPFYGDAE